MPLESSPNNLCSEDFSLLVAFLLVTFSWFFRGFFVALFYLEKQCSGLFRYFFVVFSWLFRGPRFGQILRVLALEQSSDMHIGDLEDERDMSLLLFQLQLASRPRNDWKSFKNPCP